MTRVVLNVVAATRRDIFALALVSSRLDYVNSILPGSPLNHIARLQRAQHALAIVLHGPTKHRIDHIGRIGLYPCSRLITDFSFAVCP